MSDNRQTTMKIDLGNEQADLESVVAVDGLSLLFEVRLDIITQGEIDILPHLGKPVSIKTHEDDEFLKGFHGLITDAEWLKDSNAGVHYRLMLRPWAYFLLQNKDFSIYQEKTVIEIIRDVLDEAGIKDFREKLTRSYAKREYTVQYGESDFAFISRLMEEEGIYYFWQHSDDKHEMILCDAPSCHEKSTPAKLTYNPTSMSVFHADRTQRNSSDNYIQSWVERLSTRGQSKVTIRDFDFERPTKPLEQVKEDESHHPLDAQEVYEYPGGYVQENFGGQLGQGMLEGGRHDRKRYEGKSQSTALTAGTKVKIDHEAATLKGEFLITKTTHSIVSEAFRSGEKEVEETYNVVFDAIPAATTFRPSVSTPRPQVKGLESAIVTGPADEEIFTDKYGRVKVRFHWDRSGSPDEKSTCWIRVSQTGGLGNVIIPRVGHEVLIDFLHGNPDSPIVVGRVFNAEQMPYYKLPENKTRALWKSKTYKRTASQNYGGEKLDTDGQAANYIMMEDKTGDEKFELHAEKNLVHRVRHQESYKVGDDQDIFIGGNRTEYVKKDEKIDVMGKQDYHIKGNRNVKLDANEDIKIKANQDVKIGGNQTTKITGNADITITGGLKVNVTQSIELTCGGSTIKFTPMAIEAKGMQVTITGQLTSEFKGGLTTKVKGGVLLQEEGAIVMIN